MGRTLEKARTIFAKKVLKVLDYGDDIPENEAIEDVLETTDAIVAAMLDEVKKVGEARIPGFVKLTKKEEANRLSGFGTVTAIRAKLEKGFKDQAKG